MNPNTLKYLFVFTIAVVVTTMAVRFLSPSHQGRALGTELALGTLSNNINAVGLLSIATSEGYFTLSRDENGEWLVEERGDYPADSQIVRETVLALSRLTLHEKKTSNASLYHRLNLNVPNSSLEGTGLHLLAMTSAGDVLADVVLGKVVSVTSGLPDGGIYLRIADRVQTWLAAGKVDVGRGLRDWINPIVLNVPSENVQAVTIAHRDGEIVRLAGNAGSMVLKGIPDGYVVDSEYRLDGVAGFVSELSVDDIRRDDSVGDAITKTSFITVSGLRIEIDLLGDSSEGHWLRIAAAGEGSALIKSRTQGWLFKISDWKSNNLKRRLGELIKPQEQGEEAVGG